MRTQTRKQAKKSSSRSVKHGKIIFRVKLGHNYNSKISTNIRTSILSNFYCDYT